MDVLEKLKEKNETHRQLINAENKTIWSLTIHTFFVLILCYYEIIINLDGTTPFTTLLFIYVIYNLFVHFICRVIFRNFIFECLGLIITHSALIYYWIWYQDRHGIAFLLGLLFIICLMIYFSVIMYKLKKGHSL